MTAWRPSASSMRAAFVAAAVAWALLLIAAPFAVSRPHPTTLFSVLALGVYEMGRAVCHQLPARSYYLWGAQMPVCARCTGIYFGALLGIVGARAFQVSRRRSAKSLALHRTRIALALAVAPTLITLVYEWTTGVTPSHAIRAAAGIPIGAAVAWLVVAAADNQVN
ncbi:MAG TPA: DUF2085 domain-containing protein [Vicinamibacterales bacterium]|jgi:uncharacterized membrane protein|nr:DUF2085 domain-containing protein [Vicinamibacterales bacterium]